MRMDGIQQLFHMYHQTLRAFLSEDIVRPTAKKKKKKQFNNKSLLKQS